MSGTRRFAQYLALLALTLCVSSSAQTLRLRNSTTSAEFGPRGLLSVQDVSSGARFDLADDAWSIMIDRTMLRSADAEAAIKRNPEGNITYNYELSGYNIQAIYTLKPDWRFVTKQIRILHAPTAKYMIHRVVLWNLTARNVVASDYIPSVYVPQFGSTIEQSKKSLPGKDFGEFLRFTGADGAMLTVQNPFLSAQRDGQLVTISYAPEMEWQQSRGDFESDRACIGAYRLSGHRKPREMVTEWHLAPAQTPTDGMDDAEVAAFTACVRAFLINPSPDPISVDVGWTLNDYQIDVGTDEGMVEFKRIIDTASELGIQTLLYAPGNSKLAEHAQSMDTWGWEYVLWLNLGEKIRKGEWDPTKDEIPDSVSEMLAYAKHKHVGLLAYVYPSIPFSKNPSWLVKGGSDGKSTSFTDAQIMYATLSSREFQDYLIQNLIAFQKRTGIAGYSFDYTWLNLSGSSSYAQWYGWRRVMETLRKASPSIVIDGRQSYQLFGPWSWLAGSYPHPTGTDEQPESFKPYPDLHFDRVSADRTRFVNYWYRNYQFAPEEVIPGYATHQTERSRSITTPSGNKEVEMMYTRYRPRDWDYLGFKYSFISSIATGGWNNVVNMIPARDPEEFQHFSAEDKAWIRDWLNWTAQNKEYLRHTRTILEQPALGHVDGTAAIVGGRGYLFLFNPNYKQLPADFPLDQSLGLTTGDKFLLREIYPQKNRLIGKPDAGLWTRGDKVHLSLDGTSATVLEVIPQGELALPLLFNATALHSATQPSVLLKEGTVSLLHVAGEPGTVEGIGVLLPERARISAMTINGTPQRFTQSGNYVETQAHFEGPRFAQAQEIRVSTARDGSLIGTFVVPQRVLDQLAGRKLKWPIPWKQEDYESTWLVPERLLLFVQAADASDAMPVTATLDGEPLKLQPAYSSSRVDGPCFVGFYADLSAIVPEIQHTIELRAPQMAPGQFQGIFFDNVTPQLTESIAP